MNKRLNKMIKSSGFTQEQVVKMIAANHILNIMIHEDSNLLTTVPININSDVTKMLEEKAEILGVSIDSIITVLLLENRKD